MDKWMDGELGKDVDGRVTGGWVYGCMGGRMEERKEGM